MMMIIQNITIIMFVLSLVAFVPSIFAWCYHHHHHHHLHHHHHHHHHHRSTLSSSSSSFFPLNVLSDKYLENDLVSIRIPTKTKDSNDNNNDDDNNNNNNQNDDESTTTTKYYHSRLCVVLPDLTVAPLCQHEDDVETDLFIDPRGFKGGGDSSSSSSSSSSSFSPMTKKVEDITDEDVVGIYGEGWFGQRPVPSLGGGPGYGAPAQDIWSIDEALLETLEKDGVELPILDVGIAHGEQARGGAF